MKLETANYRIAFVALALAVAMIGGPATAQDPVAHWTFDDGLNNYDTLTAIDSANGNNGAWQGTGGSTAGKTYTAGVIGGAINMRGADNDYFLVAEVPQIDGIAPTPIPPDPPVPGVGVTWMGWFQVGPNAPTGGTYKGILMSRTVMDEAVTGVSGADQNYGLAWQDDAGIQGDHMDTRISGGAVDSPNMSIQPGVWYHGAVVWGNVGNIDGGSGQELPSQRAYINGVQVGENINTMVYEILDSGSWLLGEDSCCGGREWSGLLDDLAIFDTALTGAQVMQKYNDGLAGIDAAGNNTGVLEAGDVNGVDGVTMADFDLILNNLGKTVNARNLGDLDASRKVDLNDFQRWLDAAPGALHAEALARFSSTTVPEPSSVVLVGLALIGGGVWSRRFARS